MQEQQRTLILKQKELAITSSVSPSARDEEEKEKKFIKNEQEATADDADVLRVGVVMTMNSISEINTASQSFNCRFHLRFVWVASDEDIDSWENKGGKDDTEWMPSFIPQIIFPNALTKPDMSLKDGTQRHYKINKKQRDKKTGAPYIHYDCIVQGTFTEIFELQSFPFDCQDMTMMIKLVNKDGMKKYRFVPHPGSTPVFAKFQLSNSVTTEWTMHEPTLEFGFTDPSASRYRQSYPLVIAKFRMERNSSFYLTRVCVYLAMLSALSLTTFGINVDEVGDRLSVDFTMLLAIIAYQLVVGSLLPIVEFLTFIDKYSSFATIFVSLITFENGILGYLYTNAGDDNDDVVDVEDAQDQIKSIDGSLFWIFVVVWAIGQIVFTVIGNNIKKNELKKLKMGTKELQKLYSDNNPIDHTYYFNVDYENNEDAMSYYESDKIDVKNGQFLLFRGKNSQN